MNEQTKIRLSIITSRHAKRLADAGVDAAALACESSPFAEGSSGCAPRSFARRCSRSAASLERAGHGYRVAEEAEGARPFLELHLVITGCGAARRT